MSVYYCHTCAAIKGWMTAASPASLTGTEYQLEKYIKHTTASASAAYPIVSIFDNPSYDIYRVHVVNTSASGSLEIDDQGRRNLIWVAGQQVGFTVREGKIVTPDNAVKVVLYNSEWKIHAFPTSSDRFETRRCMECGKLIVS